MKHSLRALLAVSLLVGFYVVALGVVVGLAFAVVEAALHGVPGAAVVKLGVVAAVIGIAVVRGLVTRSREKSDPPGIEITEAAQPRLWAEVREIADVVGTRAPDEIRLVAEVNAAVSEDSKLLGLVPGRRLMFVGVPLLMGLSRQQVRSVFAHELGHYSGRHTALGAVTYRGKEAIARVLSNLGEDSWVGKGLELYARLYYAASHTVSRRQELEADQLSAQVAGPTTAASALTELAPLDAAWTHFVEAYATLGTGLGRRPADLFAGFSMLLADPENEQRLARIRAEQPEGSRSVYDSHPPVSRRIDAIRSSSWPDAPDDGGAATALLDGPSDVFASLEESLYRPESVATSWEELVEVEGAAAVGRSEAALVRLQSDEGDVATFTAALKRLAASDEDREAVAEFLGDVLASHVVRADRATFALSWSQPAQLRDRDGMVLDPWAVVKEALESGNTTALTAWATEHGIDLDAEIEPSEAFERPTVTTPEEDELIGAFARVSSSTGRPLLVVTHRGLLLRDLDGGDRLAIALRWNFGNPDKALLARLEKRTIPEMVAEATSQQLLWDRIASVEASAGRVRVHLAITLTSGKRVQISTRLSTEISGEPFPAMQHYLGGRYTFVED